MPERFDLTYTDADDEQQRPVMIHRALLGSMERFAGILIEHYAGRFPVWLAPVQAASCRSPTATSSTRRRSPPSCARPASGSAVDERSESVGKKIRDAELGRYPYMLVVGDREQEAGAVAVRSHEEGELGAMPVAEFAARVAGESAAEENPAATRPGSILRALDRRHAEHSAPLSVPWPLPIPRPLEDPPPLASAGPAQVRSAPP